MRYLCRLLLLIFVFAIHSSYAQVQITLRKSFIDSLKDKVCYTGNFLLVAGPQDAAGKESLVSCSEPVIGLPIVARIVNTKENQEAVRFIQFNAGTDNTVAMSGIWNLWAAPIPKGKRDKEINYDQKKQVQGIKYKYSSSYPPHVFELYPVLKIGDNNCANAINNMEGISILTCDKAFPELAEATCELTDVETKILINVSTPSYGYTDFWIKPIAEDAQLTEDGRFVTCDVYNAKGEMIANSIRIGFVKNSQVETALLGLNSVEKLHVLAMPRISLHDVAKNIVGNNGVPTQQPLPYEMIAITALN